jgi:hypothetical protein
MRRQAFVRKLDTLTGYRGFLLSLQANVREEYPKLHRKVSLHIFSNSSLFNHPFTQPSCLYSELLAASLNRH